MIIALQKIKYDLKWQFYCLSCYNFVSRHFKCLQTYHNEMAVFNIFVSPKIYFINQPTHNSFVNNRHNFCKDI